MTPDGLTQWLMTDLFGDLADAWPVWMEDAACAGADPSLFFLSRGQRSDAAFEFCQGCPVAEECLSYALEIEQEGQEHGIWGGTTPVERRALKRQRRAA